MIEQKLNGNISLVFGKFKTPQFASEIYWPLKIPNIGRNVKASRKIMNNFLVMEVMIIFMLLGICLVGNLMSGTGLVLAFCQVEMLVVEF